MGLTKTAVTLLVGVPLIAFVIVKLNGASKDAINDAEEKAAAKKAAQANHDAAQPPMILPKETFDAAFVMGKASSAAPKWWGTGTPTGQDAATFSVGGLRIIVRPISKIERITLRPDSFAQARDAAALLGWVKNKNGEKVNARTISITPDKHGLAIVDVEDEVKANEAAARKRAADELATLTRLRATAAKRIENKLLDRRIDSHVVLTGKDNSVVRITWALCSRVTVKDIQGIIESLLDEIKAAKLECYDGYQSTAWIDRK